MESRAKDSEGDNQPTDRPVHARALAMCGADFATHIRKRYGEYGRAIREANIKAE